MDSTRVIILAGAILLLAILLLRFRKVVNLSITRLIYGKYSYEFLRKYKKSYIRSPFAYCFRDEFISHLHFVLSKKENIPSFTTTKEIYFENTPYQIDYKDFLKSKGAPSCFNAFISQHLDFEIKAIGYQAIIAGSKAVTVFYFMNDVFFMGEYIFKSPKTDVKASLLDYFLNIKNLAEDNFYIENTKNRIIHYQNTGFSVDIKYLNREDDEIIKNLQGYYQYLTTKTLEVEV